MLSRVAHELDAFWNGDFNVNLWEHGAREELVGQAVQEQLMSCDWSQLHHLRRNTPPSYSVFSPHRRILLLHCEFSMLPDSCSFKLPEEPSSAHRPIFTEGSTTHRAQLTALYSHATSRK